MSTSNRWSVVVAVVVVSLLTTTSQAQEWCPEGHGTVPGTDAGTVEVGPVYVDDRGLTSLDPSDDRESGGLWIYLETNGVEGLQRGGESVVGPTGRSLADTAGLPSEVMVIAEPMVVGPVELFPDGYCVGGVTFEPADPYWSPSYCSPFALSYYDCGGDAATAARADTLLF